MAVPGRVQYFANEDDQHEDIFRNLKATVSERIIADNLGNLKEYLSLAG
jgi:hypothetical protein